MSPFIAAALWGPLLLGAAFMLRIRTPRVARTLGISICAVVFTAALAILTIKVTGTFLRMNLGRASELLGTDGLTAALLPIAVAMPLAMLVFAPRAELDPRASANVLFVGGATLAGAVATEMSIFGVFWVLSLVPVALEARRTESAAMRRSVVLLFLFSVAPFTIACGACIWLGWKAGMHMPMTPAALAAASALGRHETWVALLFIVAIATRMGVFPLHLWIPAVAANARSFVTLPTIVSPLGCVLMVRVVLVLCPATMELASAYILPIAAASAIYGSVLALGQHNARRQLAYFWVSLMGTVLAGLVSLDERGATGALLHQLAVVLSMTGLWLHLVGVAARAGTMDLRRLGGIVGRAPGLATGFLLLGLGTVAFPGTATFLSEELLVQGLLRAHPVTAGCLLVATAVNGLGLVRTFKRIFLGRATVHAPDLSRVVDMQPRERWTSVALFLALLTGGFAPTPLLLLRAGLREPMDRSRGAANDERARSSLVGSLTGLRARDR